MLKSAGKCICKSWSMLNCHLQQFDELCCKVEKRGCNYYLPQIPEIAFLNTGLLHASAWLPFGYPGFSYLLLYFQLIHPMRLSLNYIITGLAVVTTAAAAAAALSLRKYAKHAGSCFIQCCVFVVRRSNVAAGACVFFTLCTSLRRRQGGIFRCQKVSNKKRVCTQRVACRQRWLINLLPLQLPRASKRSVKRSIQPFRQYPLQEMFEGRCVVAAVAVAVVAVVVVFKKSPKEKTTIIPLCFRNSTLLSVEFLKIQLARRGRRGREYGIFTVTSK
ncbi:hypothetical protein T11_8172 [Trichinella zimbabwensis]|uniref:Uncharacterized protein n=1 Tax=Trichinella zimbabwensis TaxID=268475 RepID=A0A0V1HZX1_9BILA|nr:hypothetical protein T11_8172 [Trichinella zimbabwensis]